ncbi:MAG: efflux RND transporter periplasmic adaptor subunit [Phycisphaerae bacterium]|nr:efflux RND transporter periplasmic adaptor subunit [Phycisphaerae bacterium]
MKKRGIILLSCLACTTLYAQIDNSSVSPQGIRAVTRPSADVQLSFVQPGRVASIMHKDGAKIQAGEVLVQLDDTVEQVLLAQIEAASRDTTQIQASQASLDQKKVDLSKMETAAIHRAVTQLEVEHARLDVTIAELALQMAVFEHEQAVRKFEETQKRINMMRLLSPISGIVEQIQIEAGESVNALDDVMRIVQIDPLWIDVSVPLPTARSLGKGQAVQVVFPLPNAETTEGRVTYVSSVADAGSGTLIVRIEVPNKSARPAGEHVRVIYSLPQ